MKNSSSILNEIIQASSISINQFSKDLDISRTYITAVLQGQKKMTEKLFKALMKLNYITHSQKERLKDSYFSSIFSEDIYLLIKYFLECARSFEAQLVPQSSDESIDEDIITENSFISDKDTLFSVVKYLILKAKQNNTEVYTDYSFENETLDNAIYGICRKKDGEKTVNISHLHYVSSFIDKPMINTYWKSLRWGFAGIETNVIVKEKPTGIFSYYLVSDNKVLIFNEDLSSGILLTDKDFLDSIISKHKEKIESSFKLLSIIPDESVLLLESNSLGLDFSFVLDNSICPENLFDHDMLLRTTYEEQPLQLREILIQSFLNYYTYTSTKRTKQFVSDKIIDDWLSTGEMHTVSQRYLKPFAPKDRVEILERALKTTFDIANLFKSEAIPFPMLYNVNVNEQSFITHYIFDSSLDTPYEIFSDIPINQISNLYTFFECLFSYLEQSENIYTQNETNFIIEQKIYDYRKSVLV